MTRDCISLAWAEDVVDVVCALDRDVKEIGLACGDIVCGCSFIHVAHIVELMAADKIVVTLVLVDAPWVGIIVHSELVSSIKITIFALGSPDE